MDQIELPVKAVALTRQIKKIGPDLTVNITDDSRGRLLLGCAGWIGDNRGHWVYVCIDHTDGFNSYAAYRTARNAKDFVGGDSYYCEHTDLANLAVQLLQASA